MKNYEVDFIESKIIVSKKFYQAAKTINTNEYKTLVQLRTENPGFAIELRTIQKKEGKKSYRNLTYGNMREYIITREGEKSESLKEFEKVLNLSKVQAGQYAYVKTWFLKKYADAFLSEETAENTAESKPNLKLVEKH